MCVVSEILWFDILELQQKKFKALRMCILLDIDICKWNMTFKEESKMLKVMWVLFKFCWFFLIHVIVILLNVMTSL